MPAIPALSRGLRLLERLAQADQPLGFTELFASLGMPRASLARTLAALHEAGWIERAASGGWKTADRLRQLLDPLKMEEQIAQTALPLMRELRDRLDATTLMGVPRGASVRILAAVTAEEGVTTGMVGRTNHNLAGGPWGGLVFAQLAPAMAKRVLARQPPEGRRRLADMRQEFQRAGYISDQGRIRVGVLRVCVPVTGASGCIALLGFLAPLGQFTELARPVAILQEVAGRLAATLAASTR